MEEKKLYNAVRKEITLADGRVIEIETGKLAKQADGSVVVKTWTEVDENSDVAVFVDINLFVKKDGEWSKPIYGNGGNKLISHERKYENGVPTIVPYLDDDAYKKAYTDAISVAAKALGVGADVYSRSSTFRCVTADALPFSAGAW